MAFISCDTGFIRKKLLNVPTIPGEILFLEIEIFKIEIPTNLFLTG